MAIFIRVFLQGANNHANHNYSAISVKRLKTESFDPVAENNHSNQCWILGKLSPGLAELIDPKIN